MTRVQQALVMYHSNINVDNFQTIPITNTEKLIQEAYITIGQTTSLREKAHIQQIRQIRSIREEAHTIIHHTMMLAFYVQSSK